MTQNKQNGGSTSSANRTKYRPSLNAAHIKYLLAVSKREYMETSSLTGLEVLRILTTFNAKIDSGAVSAAYVSNEVTPKLGSLESLGGDNKLSKEANLVSGFTSKEAYWDYCYKIFAGSDNEAKDALTLADIQAAKEHMYLNDLMTAEEITIHESQDY